jgi:hypothetical protein
MFASWGSGTLTIDRFAAGATFALVASGCIIGDETCGPHQVGVHEDVVVCICEPFAAPDPDGTGCIPCGANEEIVGDACECKAGFARAADGADCVESAAGTPCAGDASCDDPAFPYCALVGGEPGYCTTDDCTANENCPPGYTCEDGEEHRYCRKPPTGLGVACEDDDDCDGFEAQTCESFQEHICIITGCGTGESTCRNEWTCCDYSLLTTCVSPADMVDGECPMGGQAVTP